MGGLENLKKKKSKVLEARTQNEGDEDNFSEDFIENVMMTDHESTSWYDLGSKNTFD